MAEKKIVKHTVDNDAIKKAANELKAKINAPKPPAPPAK